jgi:dephospho-CoA kinase
MRIALTGGIACGKSLLARYLNELGVETMDADDIVHELIPAEERKRIAGEIFRDAAKRRELESRIHPLVKDRLEGFAAAGGDAIRVEIIPLLFECNWQSVYDIICCVSSPRSVQMERMVKLRGYSEEQAEARLAAQLPVEAKAKRSDYVIVNDGSAEKLKQEATKLVEWLKGISHGRAGSQESGGDKKSVGEKG